MKIDNAAFFKICVNAAPEGQNRRGIGTYNEKKLHFILKNYFERNPEYHEIKYNGYICDIKRENAIIEIQTSSLSGMKEKLRAFLGDAKVNVVFPVEKEKYVFWVEPSTGEISSRRRSPRPKNMYYLLSEMIYIAEYLCGENFTVTAVELSIDEYRALDGWSKDGKKGASKLERIPTKLHSIDSYNKKEDFYRFVPFEYDETFTRREYSKISSLTGRKLSAAVKVLLKVGAIEKVSDKRPYKYRKI